MFLLNFLIILSLIIFPLSSPVSLEEYLTLSHEEKLKLDEFKSLVSSRLPHDYMKKDIFLISWLREVDFNIAAAEQMLMNMVRWREENNIDTILEKDFSDLDQEYRGYIEGCDKSGRPILSLPISDWDIRKAAISGQLPRLRKYINKILEESTTMARLMQEEGQNVTQGWVLLDFGNINIISHGCPQCISFYIYLVITLQTKYPGYMHKIVALNTPQFIIPIWNTYKYLASSKIVEILEIFGKNKKEWSSYLLKEIDPSQLTYKYGGTRKEALDSQELRQLGTVFRCVTDWDELFNGKINNY